MPRSRSPFPQDATLADVLKQLGGVSPRRVRMFPAPGTATERDLLAVLDHGNRLWELIDGILVEKVMGFEEGHLVLWLGGRMSSYAEEHDLGLVAGTDSTLRLMPGLVRIPDVSFVGWERLPRRKCPREPIPDLVPHLAVEVLSEGNTAGEIDRKLREYFFAGVAVVWIVDPEQRCVVVYTSPEEAMRLTEADMLDGGTVLPGFRLPLQHLFARVEKRPRRGTRRKKRGSQQDPNSRSRLVGLSCRLIGASARSAYSKVQIHPQFLSVREERP